MVHKIYIWFNWLTVQYRAFLGQFLVMEYAVFDNFPQLLFETLLTQMSI
jgi:hypothetical protein